ncbi:MAG: hypothetical protein JKY56_24475, partial [Kofleriaceae bacterium]|nr:hypothetical protein [Kofleriaceae bacterium]
MAWKSCTSCRKDIGFGNVYWECSVSTCNRKRLGLYFCTVACWDAHLPEARHRESWAIEKRAPTEDTWKREEAQAAPEAAVRRTVSGNAAALNTDDDADLPVDVLVVVSKMKKYIRAKGDMKTS